jgi:hypothetical protein
MGNTQKLGNIVNGLSVDSSGNVSIPNGVIDIQKNQNATSNFYIRNTNTTDSSSRMYLNLVSGNAYLVIKVIHGDHSYIDSSGNIYFQNAGSVKMTMTSAGNFGIGTSSPNALLQVNGSSLIGSGTLTNGTTYGGGGQVNRLKVESGNYTCLEINGSTSGGSIQFTYGTNLPNQVGALIGYNYASGTVNGFDIANMLNGPMVFSTNATERMRITPAGNVGIGTTTVNHKFHVVGPGSSSGWASLIENNNKIGVYSGHADGYGMAIDSASNSSSVYLFKAAGGDGTNRGTYEHFKVMADGNMGNFDIKGSTGSYKSLNWGAAVLMGRAAYDSYYNGNVYYDGSSWRIKFGGYYGNVVNWYSGEYSFQRSNSNGASDSAVSLTATFYIDYNGNVVARGSVSGNGNPSDINLKENLVKISSPLDKISQINGYNFDWKQGSPANGLAPAAAAGMEQTQPILNITQDAGLIAQEVEEIMPELVRENGHKSLNYNGITALLVECIKELKAEIDILKNK